MNFQNGFRVANTIAPDPFPLSQWDWKPLFHLLKVDMDAGNVRFEGFFFPSSLRTHFFHFCPGRIETSVEAVTLL